jgi:chitin disaccharide deacetylase
MTELRPGRADGTWTVRVDPGATVGCVPTLAERLGYDRNAKLLILNCDDLGFCHAANVGVYQALRDGLGTSASLMVPCPWARGAAAAYRGDDVGVHLTVNAEFDLYRWGPITHAPSLLDGDGGFPRTVEDVWDHADLDEVRRECRAQIERAILWGFDVSHLATHLPTLQLRPEFFDVYLELALDFGLPLRMFGPKTEHYLGFPARKLAAEAGAVFTDEMLYVPAVGGRQVVEERLQALGPGVTEMTLHPAVDSAELRSLAADWRARVDDRGLVSPGGALGRAIEEAGVVLVGYRALRRLARRG